MANTEFAPGLAVFLVSHVAPKAQGNYRGKNFH